ARHARRDARVAPARGPGAARAAHRPRAPVGRGGDRDARRRGGGGQGGRRPGVGAAAQAVPAPQEGPHRAGEERGDDRSQGDVSGSETDEDEDERAFLRALADAPTREPPGERDEGTLDLSGTE